MKSTQTTAVTPVNFLCRSAGARRERGELVDGRNTGDAIRERWDGRDTDA